MKDFFCSLPVPPSANNLTKNISRWSRRAGRSVSLRATTDEYHAWTAASLHKIALVRMGWTPWHYKGKPSYGVRIEVPRLSYRRDLDNHSKPILDVLSKAGVIADDRYVDMIALEYVKATGEIADVSVAVWLRD